MLPHPFKYDTIRCSEKKMIFLIKHQKVPGGLKFSPPYVRVKNESERIIYLWVSLERLRHPDSKTVRIFALGCI